MSAVLPDKTEILNKKNVNSLHQNQSETCLAKNSKTRKYQDIVNIQNHQEPFIEECLQMRNENSSI